MNYRRSILFTLAAILLLDVYKRQQWALSHEPEMKELAAAAYQRVAHSYHWPTIIATYEQLYDRLLFNSRPVAQATERTD